MLLVTIFKILCFVCWWLVLVLCNFPTNWEFARATDVISSFGYAMHIIINVYAFDSAFRAFSSNIMVFDFQNVHGTYQSCFLGIKFKPLDLVSLLVWCSFFVSVFTIIFFSRPIDTGNKFLLKRVQAWVSVPLKIFTCKWNSNIVGPFRT